jgi:L-seryl-tRNA(Ser) seleniumtransferase
MSQDARRQLPAIDRLLQRPDARELIGTHGRKQVAWAARAALDAARIRLGHSATTAPSPDMLVNEIRSLLECSARPTLRRVINATGVVVHTNLGRAPLPEEAARRIAEVATAYSNLEMDLSAGSRGDREAHAERRLREVLRVEASLVVNNNAAAVLLALNTLAENREVLVSRGELVEIGGSFRIPEIMRKSGARLREVGTTNRTRIEDYQTALSPETAMILKVHPSNFRVLGFVESTSTAALAPLAREAGIPLVEDQGSGLLEPVSHLPGEPSVLDALKAGADLVTFSGDKVLGGPQAGLLVGRHDLVARMRRNPLYRALRVDKTTIAALDAVLASYQMGRQEQEVPVLRMLAADPLTLRERATGLAARLEQIGPDVSASVSVSTSAVGGGAAPLLEIETHVVAVSVGELGAEALAAALRASDPPVVARIVDDRVVLDPRTLSVQDEDLLVRVLETVRAAQQR